MAFCNTSFFYYCSYCMDNLNNKWYYVIIKQNIKYMGDLHMRNIIKLLKEKNFKKKLEELEIIKIDDDLYYYQSLFFLAIQTNYLM